MTDHAYVSAPRRSNERPAVRTIGLHDVSEALRRGIDDFAARPSHVIFLVVIYPIVGLLLAALSAQEDLMPLFFPLVAGFALLGPFAAIGLYEISRRREAGDMPTWRDALGVFRSPVMPQIAELAGLLTLLFVGWLVAATLIYRATMGGTTAGDLPHFLADVLTTPAGWALILAGNAVGFVFAAVAFCLGAVSFPMIIDRGVDLRTAIETSVRAVLANPVPMIAWAAIIAALMVAGFATLFVGLAVVLPVLGHATWHLYRRVVA